MVDFKDVSVVVPCHNEAATITEVIKRIYDVSREFEIIVVSDGSTDNTAELARKTKAKVIEHTYNLGNGATVKTGAAHATRRYLVFLDGDLQHPPEEIPSLLELLPDYDLVIGARAQNSEADSLRNIGNWVLIKISQTVSGHKISDLTSGFRAFKTALFLKYAHIYPLGYSYPTTTTLAFLCGGHFVKFVPLDTIVRRSKGASGIKLFQDGLRFIHIIMRVIMLFHPTKIFFPLALGLFIAGMIWGLTSIFLQGLVPATPTILVLAGIIVFLNGLLAEQISQVRMHQKNDIWPGRADDSG